jgi:hypothetical protein
MTPTWQKAWLDRLERAEMKFTGPPPVISPETSFREWCEALSQTRIDRRTGAVVPGLLVDGKPFRLDSRPAMAWIYDQVPSTREEAFRSVLVLRKCAQVGFTVFEMLAAIYLGLKFGLNVAMFLPSTRLATGKSAQRFMPILRTIPEAYGLLADTTAGGGDGEGNVLTRRIGPSLFHFLWTSSKTGTESWPVDVISSTKCRKCSSPTWRRRSSVCRRRTSSSC